MISHYKKIEKPRLVCSMKLLVEF